ncbi:MAG: ATP-grasp domain-containing protein [Alphaproteobacteria bacterium]
MTMRLLVTATGGALAPVNIRLLRESRRHDVWVLAVDLNEQATGRYFADAFATVPAGDAPDYAAAIAKLVQQHRIDLVMPWSDEEALALATAREPIEAAGATLACTATHTLGIMADKARTFETLGSAGIALPDWSLATTMDELTSAIDTLIARHGEIALKPLISRGNRNVYVIRRDITGVVDYMGSRETHLDLANFQRDHCRDLAAHLPVMVMERLYPPALDIDVLAWRGKLQYAVPRRRINPAGIPFRGTVFDQRGDLIDLAAQITELLDLSWLYDFDIMTTRTGQPVPIELNPRPSGSVAASIIAGVPFYDDLLSLAQGDIAQPQTPPAPGRTVIPYIACHMPDPERQP